jgi:hypothetical protein
VLGPEHPSTLYCKFAEIWRRCLALATMRTHDPGSFGDKHVHYDDAVRVIAEEGLPALRRGRLFVAMYLARLCTFFRGLITCQPRRLVRRR